MTVTAVIATARTARTRANKTDVGFFVLALLSVINFKAAIMIKHPE